MAQKQSRVRYWLHVPGDYTEPRTAPIRPWVRYVPKYFAMRHWSEAYPLVGQPSDELDARWAELMQGVCLRLIQKPHMLMISRFL